MDILDALGSEILEALEILDCENDISVGFYFETDEASLLIFKIEIIQNWRL